MMLNLINKGELGLSLEAIGHQRFQMCEDYSGVVSIETIRAAFVIAARNNLQVCAADISTAFLYGKRREKVYIIAQEEFGEDAEKIIIVEGGCYGLKTSITRFHE